MFQWGVLPLPLLYLSAYFHRQRETYYALLMAVSEQGNWREWLLFFLRGVAEQAGDAITRARRLQDLQRLWYEQLRAGKATSLMLGVMNRLFEQPILAANDIVDGFDVRHQTAMNTLRRLEATGIVQEMTGQQRHQRYLAGDILKALE
jgi:Fic family protein